MASPLSRVEHSALIMGVVDDGAPVLTRVHSECVTGDCFFSLRCDCGQQLRAAMKAVDDVLRELEGQGTQRGLLDRMQTRQGLYDLLGYDPTGKT